LPTATYTPSEMMIVASARQLAGERVCFVGVGPPNIACNLAKRTVSPSLELVYESGVFGSAPARLPLSIGDPTLVTGATLVCSQFELFALYLQRGLIDVGFLGASQIDRFGNINTTVIGGYERPKVRLPGSGGACEIAINAKKVFVIMPQSKRSFVERVDFVTSPGHLAGTRPPGWGGGPSVVVTQFGVYGFRPDGVMEARSLHPGVTLEEARENTAWDLAVSADLAETPAPSEDELRLIREDLDPGGAYTR
jgi:glutaconate CoA-transferase, subunit B